MPLSIEHFRTLFGRIVHVNQAKVYQNPFLDRAPTSLAQKLSVTIAWLETSKYPPNFVCHQMFESIDGKLFNVNFVRSPEINNLNGDTLIRINQKSLLLRQLNIAASLIYGLELPGYLNITAETKEAIIQKLTRLIDQTIRNNSTENMDDEINNFIDAMGSILAETAGIDKKQAIQQIKTVERYYLCEQPPKIIINQIGNYLQVDLPISNPLSAELKQEYLRIHSSLPPLWFSQLSAWEQAWLKMRVPMEAAGDWASFEKLWFPSTMQHLPGIKNARENLLLKKSGQDFDVIARSIRIATPIAIEINTPDRAQVNKINVEHLCNILKQKAQEHFQHQWQNVHVGATKPLVFIHSLLSNVFVSPEDKKMVAQQTAALQTLLREESAKPNCEIISGNDALNILRWVATDDWQHAEKIMSYAHKLLEQLNGQTLTITQRTHCHMIQAALTKMEELNRSPDRFDRNKQAFKTAYLFVLCQALGGYTSINCKSGKDRTGLAEIYQNAMLIYYQQYQLLPGYSDGAIERQRFINIFCDLFNSLKIHEAAACSSPGSFGIKDSALVLCPDIAQALGESYIKSNHRANLNKPTPGFLAKWINYGVQIFGSIIIWLMNHLQLPNKTTSTNAPIALDNTDRTTPAEVINKESYKDVFADTANKTPSAQANTKLEPPKPQP